MGNKYYRREPVDTFSKLIGMYMDKITLGHGSGGKMTHDLIKDLFFKHLGNDILIEADDSALVDMNAGKAAFTTDTFVVKPIFFPGGDIGKLSVCGTVNDIAVSGTDMKYMSCGFVIEEGLDISDLENVVKSMGEWAEKAGIKIVTGDTKVVARGEADGLFINTSGIGIPKKSIELGVNKIQAGDKIIVNGNIAEHGLAILGEREGFSFESEILSDCAPLNGLVAELLNNIDGVRFMRDPTRGGLATTLNEITSESKDIGIVIHEDSLPLSDTVRGACELLGMDPLYIANEGKIIIVVDPDDEEKALSVLRKNEYGSNSVTVGEVTAANAGTVCIRTLYGVNRIVDMHTAEQLPRIC